MAMVAAGRGITDAVRAIASGAVRESGAELVDLEFRRESAGWVLRLYIEKPGGVGIADCQRVSEVVGTLLEVEDPIPHAYTLEVSSPGLTRPLLDLRDWERAVGRRVKVVTHQPVEGVQSMTGRLAGADPGGVRIVIEAGKESREVGIPFGLVARARMELDWPAPAGGGGGPRRSAGGPKRKKKHARRR